MFGFLKHWSKHGVTHFVVHALYLSGIALLFPILVAAYGTGVAPWTLFRERFIVATILILLGALILWRSHGELGKTLRSLGWMKVVPGAIAIAFFLFGKEYFYGTARTTITGFAAIEPFFKPLFEHSLPALELFAAAYILIGILFVWTGHKISDFWS